jgi:hypothetical protein
MTYREMGKAMRKDGWTSQQVAALIRQRKLTTGQATDLLLGYQDGRQVNLMDALKRSTDC